MTDKEWLVIQIKTTHPHGIGDDIWAEMHFHLEDDETRDDLIETLDTHIKDWVVKRRKEMKEWDW
jgi:hypothetical protein